MHLPRRYSANNGNEVETSLTLQYRYSPHFEPVLELYLGEDTRGLGPVAMGAQRLGTIKVLRWVAGIIFGIEATADYTLRAVLEYEF